VILLPKCVEKAEYSAWVDNMHNSRTTKRNLTILNFFRAGRVAQVVEHLPSKDEAVQTPVPPKKTLNYLINDQTLGSITGVSEASDRLENCSQNSKEKRLTPKLILKIDMYCSKK
jgi:hypothetical protein